MECSTCMVVGVQCSAVDLSYPLDDTTIFWPGGEKFKLCMNCSVCPEFGYDYAAGTFSCAEHGGTHVDAPFHFAKDGKTVDLISLCDLIAPSRVIDISQKCSDHGPDYTLTVNDIEAHEELHGRIEQGCIVLVRTGWSRRWKEGAKSYLGFDEATEGPYDDKSQLSFPGIGVDAAHLLVERKVAAVGLDTGNTAAT
jgi:kynurenine formamidase